MAIEKKIDYGRIAEQSIFFAGWACLTIRDWTFEALF
jgi:hypothetical protein